jgi:hypothetical protein
MFVVLAALGAWVSRELGLCGLKAFASSSVFLLRRINPAPCCGDQCHGPTYHDVGFDQARENIGITRWHTRPTQ